MSGYKNTVFVIITLATLTACGNSPGQRALSGGAIGAGAGAVGGALIGGDPLTGALIGGGVGAVTGAVTNRHQIDLGR
jgi:osmotically inducible lipoprotein OsmB